LSDHSGEGNHSMNSAGQQFSLLQARDNHIVKCPLVKQFWHGPRKELPGRARVPMGIRKHDSAAASPLNGIIKECRNAKLAKA
jgi:hypothetical protein